MDLKTWVDGLGADGAGVAAERLGEKRRTVRSWLYFERVPSFSAAMKIVETSEGSVDFNGVYQPFMDRARAAHGRV